MSNELWASQMSINEGLMKRIELTESQLSAVTELAIAQGKLIAQLVKAAEPSKCGKHCACEGGN